jgi:hypothetical protein
MRVLTSTSSSQVALLRERLAARDHRGLLSLGDVGKRLRDDVETVAGDADRLPRVDECGKRCDRGHGSADPADRGPRVAERHDRLPTQRRGRSTAPHGGELTTPAFGKSRPDFIAWQV